MFTPEEAEAILRSIRPLDCGALYCRYCPAGSHNQWQHEAHCIYQESVRLAEKAYAAIVRLAQPETAASPRETLPKLVDIPLAWELTRATKPEQHHEKCSYRVASMLCDCAAFDVMREISRRFKAIAAAPSVAAPAPTPAPKMGDAENEL